MSGNHAWRTGSGHVATRIGVAVLLTGALSTITAASQKEADQSPIVLAAATYAALPVISEDADLVNISPLLEPAPDIFDGKGRALWDGRRTLRGVWVAHPMAQSARRVRIYNLQNGAVVDGALFKKDAVATDDGVIVSSDAAEKLGLEPNGAAQLRIVGVRPAAKPEPEKVPAAAPEIALKFDSEKTPTTVAERDTTAPAATESKSTKIETPAPEDAPTMAMTPVASDEREPGTPPIPRARPGTSLAASGEITGDRTGLYPSAGARAAAGFKFVPDGEGETISSDTKSYFKTAPTPTAESAEEPVKVTRVEPIAPVVKTVEEPTVKLAMATEAIVDPVAGAAKSPAKASDLIVRPATPVRAAAAGAGDVPAKPARRTPAPTSATVKADTPEPDPIRARTAKTEKPAAAVKVAATPGAAVEKTPAVSGELAKPYVQAGFFGVHDNAKRLVERLQSQGIPAKTRAMKAGGKDFLRVLAGPFADAATRDKAQTKIRAMGLKDALPVKG